MNIIPTIFNEKIIPYTAVGGKERSAASGISAVVLNPPGFARRSFFSEIEKTGFDNIISMESSAPHYEIEELSGRFPFVRFILPENELNMGEQINLAASEIASPLFYVLRSDLKIVAGGTAKRMAERLSIIENENENNDSNITENEENNDEKDEKKEPIKIKGFKRLCTVPVIVNSNYEVLPSLTVPITYKKKMKTALIEPNNENDLSLFPFDGLGIYDRKRFILLGGFDPTINKTHWQLMDFGLRAFLWGEEIAVNLHLKITYENEIPAQDCTVEEHYRRFYLKNLAPDFRGYYAHLPFYRFPNFYKNSGEVFLKALEEFKHARKWVITNKYRWKCDAHTVAGLWEKSNTGDID